MSGLSNNGFYCVTCKMSWSAIDVRFLSNTDIPTFVHSKLQKVRDEKERLESSNFDGIISDSVMVECKKEDSAGIIQKCSGDFRLKTNLGNLLIFYIS